jgi:hypothetical protein
MLMPLDLESNIMGHGVKIQAGTSRRALNWLPSGFEFTF